MKLHTLATLLLLAASTLTSHAADTTPPDPPSRPAVADPQRYYDAALRINPKHLGALEYAGELALMKGELPVAEARLAALDKACNARCEEWDDLKNAIARYKANGGRWVP